MKVWQKVKKVEFEFTDPAILEEDEETLAAIDRGIKAADEGRVVPAEKVRKLLRQVLLPHLHVKGAERPR